MSGTAVTLLVVALVVVWGGLAVSIAALVRRPERTSYPHGWEHEGGPEDRPDEPVEHDT
ncbi:methionine/alanine import family NSS transporter small subunit [Promicromonospora kroppenstedtii]|uniref:Methionine/alanine import family NSS transporter small subunit n=1 Tax=Promicromonospora kroppenstedtii TaxID=440482 RepID=A0ABW7XJH4_9MICO|nr:methionine/alanine import family NSS transporter small subunit [Promicromonospora kroppenstedtii]